TRRSPLPQSMTQLLSHSKSEAIASHGLRTGGGSPGQAQVSLPKHCARDRAGAFFGFFIASTAPRLSFLEELVVKLAGKRADDPQFGPFGRRESAAGLCE